MDLIGTGINRLCEFSRSGDFKADTFVEVAVATNVVPTGHYGVAITAPEALPVSPVTPQSTQKDLVSNAVNRLCEYMRSGNFSSTPFEEVAVITATIPAGHYGVSILSTIQLPVSPVTPQSTLMDMADKAVNRLCAFLRFEEVPGTAVPGLFDFAFDGGLG